MNDALNKATLQTARLLALVLLAACATHSAWAGNCATVAAERQVEYPWMSIERWRQMFADVFGKGVKIEVGDMLPSRHYAERLKRVPRAWEKAFEVNNSSNEAMRASCVEFVLNGLYATDRISRAQKHGRISFET